MIIIAVWVAFGVLGTATAFALAASVLICAAFANWFSPFRFIFGTLLALAAYATATPAPARPTRPSATAAVAAAPLMPSGLASNVRGDVGWVSFPDFGRSHGTRSGS